MSIRFALESDLPQILEIYTPFVTDTTYSFEYTVPTEKVFLQRFRHITDQFPWIVWEENGRILGYAYGSRPFERTAYHWCSEASVYVRPEVQRRGLGRALYAALEEILRLQGYVRVYALITEENTISIAFHQAMGYTHTARFPNCGFKFGKWLDVVWMEKQLNIAEIPSHFPIPVKDIVKNNRNISRILATLSLS